MKKRSIQKGYLLKVRPVQNKKWTNNEKVIVYTYRNEGMPSKDIAKKMKCSTIQIYNITRLMRSGIKQRCFCCGKKLDTLELLQKNLVKACNVCKKKFREYKKMRLKEAHDKGLCCYCHKRKALKGYKSCAKCVSATHRRRMLNDLCGQCGKHPPHKKGAFLCVLCKKKNALRIKSKREINYEQNKLDKTATS